MGRYNPTALAPRDTTAFYFTPPTPPLMMLVCDDLTTLPRYDAKALDRDWCGPKTTVTYGTCVYATLMTYDVGQRKMDVGVYVCAAEHERSQ